MVCGLILVCGGLIFLLFTRQEPASSQEPSEERPFRINDGMLREQDELLEPTGHLPDDRLRRDQ
jgi:hypothetical protein